MMANNDPQLDKENTQFHQSEFVPNASGATKSYCAFLPKLIIPQLKVPQRVTDMTDMTAESIAAQEEQHRAADAHNEMLLNEIKRRREQNDSHGMGIGVGLGLGRGSISVPKLRTSGQSLDKPQFNIPLLNKLHSQNNSLAVNQLERDVNKLKITTDDCQYLREQPQQQQEQPTALIDLTKTVIAVHKDALPREAATKVRNRTAVVTEHFDIPFISCDILRNRLSVDILSKKRQTDGMETESESPIIQIVVKSSIVGEFIDRTVGYPKPRKPQLKYAVTPLELLHLKMCKREDYGSNIKRFCFDTPSPDEKVKEALQKSWRISRT
ncbi:uncharacterized protein LOC117786245 [Drosophila innubila]|uniref:uncharacterized protein LOC117786245 n=1 Tax=Drosophila innubila TaxID=198719 RepID=UPI00148B95E2|nr:uncharacterized protein LOC117786245 [Drosophila innubila]